MGDREEQDMPAAGIATSGPGTGTSNIGDAGKETDCVDVWPRCCDLEIHMSTNASMQHM